MVQPRMWLAVVTACGMSDSRPDASIRRMVGRTLGVVVVVADDVDVVRCLECVNYRTSTGVLCLDPDVVIFSHMFGSSHAACAQCACAHAFARAVRA